MYIVISKPKRISLAAGVDHFILVLLNLSQRIVATGLYMEIYTNVKQRKSLIFGVDCLVNKEQSTNPHSFTV